MAEELKESVGEWEKGIPQDLDFIEEIVLNAVIEILKLGDIEKTKNKKQKTKTKTKTIEYLSDLLKLNPQNYLVNQIWAKIEKKIINTGTKSKIKLVFREWKDNVLELKYTSTLAIVLLVGIILEQALFFSLRPNLAKFNETYFNIIKTASETLLKAKLETL